VAVVTKNADDGYEVALSFAGEDRPVVDPLARLLRDLGVTLFYDRFEQPKLWGKDLYQHLSDIYKNRAKFVVVFVSKHFISKAWPKHELHNAQARAFQGGSEYILPVRLDDTPVPGLNETIGYIDFNEVGHEGIVKSLFAKLGRTTIDMDVDIARASWDGSWVTFNEHEMVSYWPPQIEQAQEKAFYKISTTLERIPWGKEPHNRKKKKLGPCHDCGVLPGQYHVPSCDMEWCPACGWQALGCDCVKIECEPPEDFVLETE
jgi:hypothetical protein